jgi:DNA-binding CsgD family transcriptional regulator
MGQKNELQLLEEMNALLRQITGLLAIQGKSEDQQIVILTGLGLDLKTIGMFLGISPDAVRMRRTRSKRH